MRRDYVARDGTDTRELSWVTLQLTVSQSVRLGLEPLCASWPDFSWSYTVTGLMSWGVFPNGRTGLSSLDDPLVESSSLDPIWSLLCFIDPLLKSSSLDPLWSLLYSTLFWSFLHLTLSGVSFTRPSTGVFFTWPSLESPLHDPLLESSSLDPLWSLLCTTLY
jgi:hypothetical protein